MRRPPLGADGGIGPEAPRRPPPEIDRVLRAVRTALDALTCRGAPDALAAPAAPDAATSPDTSAAPERPRPHLVVALSGGLDSCVLLHALRFGLQGDFGLIAAHFDHRMRQTSARDAAWARGLCRAWDIDLSVGEAHEPPTSEEAARRARYAFLESVRVGHEPARLLTAHHADDQAETVLFRALRGTGIEGLAGIPEAREPGIVRPLLDVWREELEAYAGHAGLSWREDATNEHLGYARNVLRHELLPLAETKVAPGARAALVRLADIARSERVAWAEALEIVMAALDVERAGGDRPGASRVSVDRDALAALGSELRARALRHLVGTIREGDADHRLSAGATERAVDFVASGSSGSGIELGGGLELRRELDRIAIGTIAARPAPDREVTIGGAGPEAPLAGEAEARLAGRAVRVRWRTAPPVAVEAPAVEGPQPPGGESPGHELEWATFPVRDLALPLRVRARRSGDRIAQAVGTRKVKKAMLEARVPASGRDEVAVLVDACDRVLWIPGVARSTLAGPAAGGDEAPSSDRVASAEGREVLWIGIAR